MIKRLPALLLCLLLVLPVTESQAAVNTRTNLFLEMMLTMMEIMGMIDRNDNYYNQPYPVMTPGLNNFSQGMQNPMGNQWQSALQMLALQQMLSNYGGAMALPGNFANPNSGLLPNQTAIPFLPEYFNQTPQTSRHWIEGKWQSSDGMIMEVRQGQFKMYYRHLPREVRGGLLRIKDKWLAIYESSHQITRQYEFAYKDDRLVLKDTSGNMMLFKRMTDWAMPLQ